MFICQTINLLKKSRGQDHRLRDEAIIIDLCDFGQKNGRKNQKFRE